MYNGLTYKQHMFCLNIVNGMTGIDAYMNAYDSHNKNVANVESTKLLKREDITAHIQELYKPIKNHNENTIINDRKKQIEYIKGRIALCEQKDDEQSIIRYTDMLNKLLALYKETESDQKDENKFNNIDTATLIKLSGAS